jgi:hypothetical protein
MRLQFSLTVSDNLQNFGFFLLKSVTRDFYPQCFVEPPGYALGLQTAPRIKIIHFTPSVHNILFCSFWNRHKYVTNGLADKYRHRPCDTMGLVKKKLPQPKVTHV